MKWGAIIFFMQGSPTTSKAIFAIVLLLVTGLVWGVVVYHAAPGSTTDTVVANVIEPTVTPQTANNDGSAEIGMEENVDINLDEKPTNVPTTNPTKVPTPTNTPVPTKDLENPTTTTTPANTPSPVQRKFTLTVSEYSFAPQTITATPGDTLTITIVNNGSQIHNFVIDELGVQTTTIDPETSIVATVKIPSNPETLTYTFYSSIGTDRALGMEGTISVTQ